MIREVIASFKKSKCAGFTLVEMVSVLAILGILGMLMIPPMTSYIESSRRQIYLSEAEMVSNAVGIYIAQKNLNGTVSAWDLYEELIFCSLDSADSPIGGMLSTHSSDGKIVSVMYNERKRLYEGIIYHVGGYKITVMPGKETKVSKL